MNKIIIVLMILLIISCKKKPPESKLVGKWKIESAYVNGVDKTTDLDTLQILYYEFKKFEDIERVEYYSYIIRMDYNIAHWEDSCAKFGPHSYEINEEKTEITFPSVSAQPNYNSSAICFFNSSYIPGFIYVHSIYIPNDYLVEQWKIIKWKRDDFWVSINHNGNFYEVHFKEM